MHIAYISMGATGHVLASLPFCGELVKMGHRVSYFTAEYIRPQVEAFGLHFYPVPSPLNNGGKGDKNAMTNLVAELPLRFLNEAACGVESIIAVLENDKPELIINDTMAVSGRLVSSYLDVPRIQFFTSFAANEFYNSTQHWPEGIEETEPRKKAAQLAKELQEKYGGPLIRSKDIFVSTAKFNIVTVDRRFQPFAETFGEEFYFAGPQIAERAGEAEWKAPDNGKKNVYASLGTVFNNQPWFWPILFEAVSGLGINLICSVGNMIRPEDFGKLPEDIYLYPFLPQLKVLQHTDAFVSHGGPGSIMEATWFGVPTVCIPQMGDQMVTAGKVVDLGLGRAIMKKEDVTPENIREAVLDILENPSYRKQIEAVRTDMKENGGPRRAAEKALEWLQSEQH